MTAANHYSNATRVSAAGYQVFGADLPALLDSTDYAHNRGAWPGSAWDFSGCPLCRSQSGTLRSSWTGALITPRHVLIAHHITADISVGHEFTFVDPSGTAVVRTVAAKSGNLASDLAILTLDAAVTGCKVYAIPTAASLPSLVGMTLWCLLRSRKIVTRTAAYQAASVGHAVDSTGGTLTDDTSSSGQPAFLTRGNDLVLLGTHYTAASFPSAGYHLSVLQAFCDTVGETIQTVSIDPASWAETLEPLDL